MKFNIDEVIDMLNSGKTIRDVSSEIDVAYTTINNHLKRNGFSYDKESKKWTKESEDDDMAKTALTSDEINFVRKMYEFYSEDVGKATLMSMFANMNHFHNKKRYTYILSDHTHDQFKSFSDDIRNTLDISYFELVELALLDFMEKYRTIV
ncbi:helix-turn-helix domain-containing protein [Salmonella enterica subsp. enterica serovar Dublin]|nr:helix-turn-helix domain-containing protein [Salmonella enterica subsp. enterica serovar Dublin]